MQKVKNAVSTAGSHVANKTKEGYHYVKSKFSSSNSNEESSATSVTATNSSSSSNSTMKAKDMKKSEAHMPTVIGKNSTKPVFHFEEHDGDWGEDDLNHWENASKDFKDESDLEDWKDLFVEKHHGKLAGGQDNGHFFAHQNEDSAAEESNEPSEKESGSEEEDEDQSEKPTEEESGSDQT